MSTPSVQAREELRRYHTYAYSLYGGGNVKMADAAGAFCRGLQGHYSAADHVTFIDGSDVDRRVWVRAFAQGRAKVGLDNEFCNPWTSRFDPPGSGYPEEIRQSPESP